MRSLRKLKSSEVYSEITDAVFKAVETGTILIQFSEVFSADYLRFKNYQRWPALLQFWFSAVHFLKISDQRWKINFSEQLKQRWTGPISSETAPNSDNFLWNSYEQRWFFVDSGWQLLIQF